MNRSRKKRNLAPDRSGRRQRDSAAKPSGLVDDARDLGGAAALRLGGRDVLAAAAVCVLLLLAVVVVFGQTVNHEFLDYDDNAYVRENPPARQGLTAAGVAWAFTSTYAANWHPLTWLSHMLDCHLYGLQPGGHHLTNTALHAATAILLFLVLWRMTLGLWPSAS